MEYTIVNGELYHFGVKGMKWGHRKKYYNADGSLNRLGQARQNLKTANKEYGKAYNKAYNYSNRHMITQWYGKNKRTADNNWGDAYDKARAADKAKQEYKAAKKERKDKINKAYDAINKQTSLAERFIFNEATRKGAAKYVVDHNMSMEDARKRANNEAVRNTAIALAAYGAVTVASLYKKK